MQLSVMFYEKKVWCLIKVIVNYDLLKVTVNYDLFKVIVFIQESRRIPYQ